MAYQDVEVELDEVLDLGNGVGFVIASIEGQLVASTAHLRVRFGAVYQWADELIVRVGSYADVEHVRAVAERLAEEPVAAAPRFAGLTQAPGQGLEPQSPGPEPGVTANWTIPEGRLRRKG